MGVVGLTRLGEMFHVAEFCLTPFVALMDRDLWRSSRWVYSEAMCVRLGMVTGMFIYTA